MVREAVEDFFLNRFDTGRIFEVLERSEYLVLYNVRLCMERSGEDRVYMSELAEQMKLSVVKTSEAVKDLENKGYLTWQMDENKERTFVGLTDKAKDAMERQNEFMEKAYRQIMDEIPEEELRQTMRTLGKMREILKAQAV